MKTRTQLLFPTSEEIREKNELWARSQNFHSTEQMSTEQMSTEQMSTEQMSTEQMSTTDNQPPRRYCPPLMITAEKAVAKALREVEAAQVKHDSPELHRACDLLKKARESMGDHVDKMVSTKTSDVILQEVSTVFNGMLFDDPSAISGILQLRFPCSRAFIDHPTLSTREEQGEDGVTTYSISVLGLINAILLSVIGGKIVATVNDAEEIISIAPLPPNTL